VGAGLVWPAIRCAISIVPHELMYSVTPVIAKHKSEHVSDESKPATLSKAKQLHRTRNKQVQWGMSNVLKVMQTTIYSLAVRVWSQR
jgi:hypothetical protein